jgi:glucose dehydrogenase
MDGMMLRTLVTGVVLALTANAGWSKLPPPTEEQKAKAEEAKAKAAETAKKDGEALARTQEQVAERYLKLMKEKGIEVKPTPIAPPTSPAAAAPPAPATGAGEPKK